MGIGAAMEIAATTTPRSWHINAAATGLSVVSAKNATIGAERAASDLGESLNLIAERHTSIAGTAIMPDGSAGSSHVRLFAGHIRRAVQRHRGASSKIKNNEQRTQVLHGLTPLAFRAAISTPFHLGAECAESMAYRLTTTHTIGAVDIPAVGAAISRQLARITKVSTAGLNWEINGVCATLNRIADYLPQRGALMTDKSTAAVETVFMFSIEGSPVGKPIVGCSTHAAISATITGSIAARGTFIAAVSLEIERRAFCSIVGCAARPSNRKRLLKRALP